MGLIPRSGRSPGEESGNPLQYCCLENSMERGAWQATAHGDTKELDMTEQLNTHTHKRLGQIYLLESPMEADGDVMAQVSLQEQKHL